MCQRMSLGLQSQLVYVSYDVLRGFLNHLNSPSPGAALRIVTGFLCAPFTQAELRTQRPPRCSRQHDRTTEDST